MATQTIVNIKDFGAKGDGKTNDYPALQAAVNEAAKQSAKVYLPEGIYKLD